jgi:hypothetical protein
MPQKYDYDLSSLVIWSARFSILAPDDAAVEQNGFSWIATHLFFS